MMNAPDDTIAERATKVALHQCCILPILVVLIAVIGVAVLLVTHHR